MKVKLILLLLPFFILGCMRPQQAILGTWEVDTEENFYFTFMDNEELSVNNEIYMKYSIIDDTMLILGEEEPVMFSIKGDTMSIFQGDHTITLTRVRQAR